MSSARVRVTFVDIDETAELDPDSRVIHRFEVEPGAEGQVPTPGPCGLVSARLDHGISIEAEPMRLNGLVRVTVDVLGDPVTAMGRHFADDRPDDEAPPTIDDRAGSGALTDAARELVTDLLGPGVAGAIADRSQLRNIGDATVVDADDVRWDVARQLAWCEAEAGRHGAPTTTIPSFWAAESARLAQRLSGSLADWASGRAHSGAAAMALLPPADAIGSLAATWPALTEVATVIRGLAGEGALGSAASLFASEPPELVDVDAAIDQLEQALTHDLTFRGASTDPFGARLGHAPPLLLGPSVSAPEQAVLVPSVVLRDVVDLVEPGSATAEWRESSQDILVQASLSATGLTLTDEPGGKQLLARELSAACADPSNGIVLTSRGFKLEEDRLFTTLEPPARGDPLTAYEVRIHRRGHDDRRARAERAIGDAIDASREALTVTNGAFSRTNASALRRNAVDAWDLAAGAWERLDQAAMADRCGNLAEACRDLAEEDADPNELLLDLDLPPVNHADLLLPGVRAVLESHAVRVLEEIDSIGDLGPLVPEQPGITSARTFAKVARGLGLVEQATEVSFEASDALHRSGAPLDEHEVADAVWAALSLEDRPDLIDALARLLTDLEHSEPDEDDR